MCDLQFLYIYMILNPLSGAYKSISQDRLNVYLQLEGTVDSTIGFYSFFLSGREKPVWQELDYIKNIEM